MSERRHFSDYDVVYFRVPRDTLAAAQVAIAACAAQLVPTWPTITIREVLDTGEDGGDERTVVALRTGIHTTLAAVHCEPNVGLSPSDQIDIMNAVYQQITGTDFNSRN